MSRRIGLCIISIVLISIGGGLSIDWLNNKCPQLSPSDCRLMWGTALSSVVGGILLVEFLYSRKKTQSERSSVQNTRRGSKTSSQWYIWIRPVAWVLLSSLFAGLPLMVQGALGFAFFGTVTGMFLDILLRAILNRLPALEKDNDT